MKKIELLRVRVEQLLDLRHAVLREGLPREADHFTGDDDPQTVHIGAFHEDKLVGCASIMVNALNFEPACQLRGMAVDPEYQRRGIGGIILKSVDRVSAAKGFMLLWANARSPAVPFYVKNGWGVVSEEFDIPQAGLHFKITKRLKT